MQVEVEATKLINSEVEFVSMVEHGAIREPFKVLKTEELYSNSDNLTERLSKAFGMGGGEQLPVTSVFVKAEQLVNVKEVISKYLTLPEDHVVKGETGIIEYRLDGYTGEDVQLIALSKGVVVGVEGEFVKGYNSYPDGKDYDSNLSKAAFFPGLRLASEVQMDTLWNILMDSESMETAKADMDKAMKAYNRHVKSLMDSLPIEVMKLESALLQVEKEEGTVSPTIFNDDTAGAMQMTQQLTETVAGDLDGLSLEEDVTKTADNVEENHEEAPVSEAEEVQAETYTKSVEILEDGKLVTKTAIFEKAEGEGEDVFLKFEDAVEDEENAESEMENKIMEGLATVAKAVKNLGDEFDALKGRIDTVEKAQVKKTVRQPSSAATNLDESLAGLSDASQGQDVQKGESGGLWDGVLVDIAKRSNS